MYCTYHTTCSYPFFLLPSYCQIDFISSLLFHFLYFFLLVLYSCLLVYFLPSYLKSVTSSSSPYLYSSSSSPVQYSRSIPYHFSPSLSSSSPHSLPITSTPHHAFHYCFLHPALPFLSLSLAFSYSTYPFLHYSHLFLDHFLSLRCLPLSSIA